MRRNLFEFRKNLGLTQQQMGGLFGVSKEHWCNIEKGRIKGSAELWIGLGSKFKLTSEEVKNLMEVET